MAQTIQEIHVQGDRQVTSVANCKGAPKTHRISSMGNTLLMLNQVPKPRSSNQAAGSAIYRSAVFISFSNPSMASPFWEGIETFSDAAPSVSAALRTVPRSETGGLLNCTGDLAAPERSSCVGVLTWSCWLALSADSGGEDKPDSALGLDSVPLTAAGWSGGACGVCVRGGGWCWMPSRWGVDAQDSLWYLRLWSSRADSLRSSWWSLT